MQPRISVCICTYERYDVLPMAIDSALKQSLDRSAYRIIVIDNSPDGDAAETFGSAYADEPLIKYRIERIPGLSNARNVGARECDTEFIAFMDDDAIASPDWLKKLLEGADHFGDGVAMLGGPVYPIWEAPRPPWLSDTMLSLVSAIDWGGSLRLASPNEWFAGTNITFRTQAILDAGGFDVKLGRIGGGTTLLSNEEIAIVDDLRKQGKTAVYVPEASVRHLVERRRITQAWFRKRIVWQAISDYIAQPETARERATRGWQWAMSYFTRLPPRERTIRGLHYATDAPDLFKMQLDVLYLHTLMSLSGFDEVESVENAVRNISEVNGTL